jgi:hypothetical protein
MKKAWEISREGQKKYGGRIKEYFSEALRMAWQLVKMFKDVVKRVNSNKWVKNGYKRIYVEVEFSLIEMKHVRNVVVGAIRRIEGVYYYDCINEKLCVQNERRIDLSSARNEVVAYMDSEINKIIKGEIAKWQN